MRWRERLPVIPHIHFMAAAPLDAWARLLLTPGVRIGWRYWPRVVVNVALSTCVTAITLPERLLLAPVLWWVGRRSGWRLGGAPGGSRGSAPDGPLGEVPAVAERAGRRLPSPAQPPQVGGERAMPPSIVILGYYRSGTTHLHNLLACDPANVTPRWGQVLAPHGFVLSWFVLKLFLWVVLPTKRPQDDMAFGPEWPGEDDFAMSNWTLTSPLPGRVVVPHAYEHFHRFHDLQGLTHRERRRWRRTQWAILWKIALVGRGRRLLLKTPPHTARVDAIAEVLDAPISPPAPGNGGSAPGGSRGSAPDHTGSNIQHIPPPSFSEGLADAPSAQGRKPHSTGGQAARGTRAAPRFICLTRDRDAVLASNERLMRAMRPFHLHEPPSDDTIRARLAAEYAATEAAFEAQAPSIPPGCLCRMRYDDLIADPMGQVRSAYETLGLEWTGAFESRLGEYLASVASYRSETRKIAERSGTPEPPGDRPGPSSQSLLRSRVHDRHGLMRLLVTILLTVAIWSAVAWLTGHRSAIFAMLGGIAVGHAATARRPGSTSVGLVAAALSISLSALGMLIATRLADFRAPPAPNFETLLPAAWRRFTHESTLLWTTLGALAAFRLGSRRFRVVPGA